MSHGFNPAHPLLRVDNGRAYQLRCERDLKNAQDAFKLKKLECQCLADIGRKLMADIRNKNATISLLQKRLAAAGHYHRRAA